MRRTPPNWRSDRGVRALAALRDIQRSIGRLDDEDLLDLHDIFLDAPETPLARLAAAEMAGRRLKP